MEICLKMGANRKPRSKRLHLKKLTKQKKKDVSQEEPVIPPKLGEVINAIVPKFRGFYELSGIKFSEVEWRQFIRSLRSPLPISFRARHAQLEVPNNSDRIQPIGLHQSYQISLNAKIIKQVDPTLNTWLIEQTKLGAISRQEVASMIPVAVLGVKRNHRVLEMCASPGSKTTQASDIATDGVVVANELSRARSHTLANRAAARNVVVTCHKAQTFPDSLGHFDRIICDVPCSGDGAIRKYVDKWAHWDSTIGRQLHATQIQIGLRAARLLRVGGQMAYSTCSLNPIENEAVVASILKATGGALELVERRLPSLQLSPGLTAWEVVDEDLNVVSQLDTSNRYRASMFASNQDTSDLWKCMRLYPHVNDTGGFFVAVLRKKFEWPSNPTPSAFLKCTEKFHAISTSKDVKVRKVKKSFLVNEATANLVSCDGSRFVNVVSVGLAK